MFRLFCRPSGFPSADGSPRWRTPSVGHRDSQEDLPALGPVAHHEAQRLHATPARAGFWRRALECATSGSPARPTRTPGRAVSGRPSSCYWRAFRLLGRAQLPTPPVGWPTLNFLAPVRGPCLRSQGTPGDRSKNTRFVETINTQPCDMRRLGQRVALGHQQQRLRTLIHPYIRGVPKRSSQPGAVIPGQPPLGGGQCLAHRLSIGPPRYYVGNFCSPT
jgi:hypothetical protein